MRILHAYTALSSNNHTARANARAVYHPYEDPASPSRRRGLGRPGPSQNGESSERSERDWPHFDSDRCLPYKDPASPSVARAWPARSEPLWQTGSKKWWSEAQRVSERAKRARKQARRTGPIFLTRSAIAAKDRRKIAKNSTILPLNSRPSLEFRPKIVRFLAPRKIEDFSRNFENRPKIVRKKFKKSFKQS